MSLNACKAGHIIHDFMSISPISSCIKHIIVFPYRIPWSTELIQQLTCITKYFTKSCIVLSDIYWPMAWSSLPPSPFNALVSRNEQQRFSLPSSIWLNLQFWRDPASRVWTRVALWAQKVFNKVSPVLLICSVSNEREKKRRQKREREGERERANYSGFKYFTLHRILCIN